MNKGPNAYRTISEAAQEVGVPQHVLRFWETKFPFIKPLKRAGSRRFYKPADIIALRAVRTLLHDQGFKIEGVQKLYRDQGLKRITSVVEPAPAGGLLPDPALDSEPRPDLEPSRLHALLDRLETAKARLDKVLSALGG